jgi:hypothetical protein
MQALEVEVRARHAQIENEVVEEQVGDIVPDLGCTRNRDTKFYQNGGVILACESNGSTRARCLRSRKFRICSNGWKLWSVSLVC